MPAGAEAAAGCSRLDPISRIQLRTSAAMPPGTYPGTPERGRPRRCKVRDEGENGAGTSSSPADGDGERARTKAGLRLEAGDV